MYRLTTRRLHKAEPILEKYRDKLYRHLRFEAWVFENELKECWNVGYQEIKYIMLDMLRLERYRYLVLYYMQSVNTCVVSEFQGSLAEAYGSKDFYAPDMNLRRKTFWATFAKIAQRESASAKPKS